jgi:molybdate transport system ATP-binding protein
MSICLTDVSAEFASTFMVSDINWSIEKGQHWALVGHNGAGKSALGSLLAGYGDIQKGTLDNNFGHIELVSYESQQALIEQEREKDSADILDVIAVPTKVHELLYSGVKGGIEITQSPLFQRLIELFEFTSLLSRDFSALSTGETRKLLLIKALLTQPDLLILDEPFDGLDSKTHQKLSHLFDELQANITMVFVLNRWSEIPDFISHYGLVAQGRLQSTIGKQDQLAIKDLKRLLTLQQSAFSLPERDESVMHNLFLHGDCIVLLKQVAINYPQGPIFEDLSWEIKLGQHWQLSGPNGSGKTCLLQLISGDHPQCYVNDIFVFGFKRGSGESIWDIKKHIGFLSNAFHLSYRVNCSLLHVVLSGFYDSIGLYQQPTKKQALLAKQWLDLIGLGEHENTPFQQLSFGDQRLALIVRAMVKHPPLLILDEPCNGLDEINRQRILAVISTIAQTKTTSVIYVNHHSDDVIDGINNHIHLHGDSSSADVRYTQALE